MTKQIRLKEIIKNQELDNKDNLALLSKIDVPKEGTQITIESARI